MRWLQRLRCQLGMHGNGRYCPCCGARVDATPLGRYRVRSRHDGSLDVEVEAVDERHAAGLAAPGWHRDNLEVEPVDPAPRR